MSSFHDKGRTRWAVGQAAQCSLREWKLLGGSWRRQHHAFGRFERVGVAEVAVALGDEDAAVFVTQPTRDDFEIDAGFDGVAGEVMPQGVVASRRRMPGQARS